MKTLEKITDILSLTLVEARSMLGDLNSKKIVKETKILHCEMSVKILNKIRDGRPRTSYDYDITYIDYINIVMLDLNK